MPLKLRFAGLFSTGTRALFVHPNTIEINSSIHNRFVPLPKSSKPERVLTNSQVYDFELSEEDMAALDALDKGKAGAITWNPVDAP